MVRDGGQWTYFCGIEPIFCHDEKDERSFRMFTAQLVCQGACKQVDIIKAFGVSKNSVKRSVKKYGQGGVAAFYQPRKGRGATVLTSSVVAQAQQLLNIGWSRTEVAEKLDIKRDTLVKAIRSGRLTEPTKLSGDPVARQSVFGASGDPATENLTASDQPPATDKSGRSTADATADMGVGCTRPDERVLASFGLIDGASTCFETCRDVTFGGVLCALPALVENGLFRHLRTALREVRGYYTTLHVIILLAYMALCRVKTVEQLQYESPGEFGKLLGLDRIPEVRCLRKKLSALSSDDGPDKWAGLLSQDWLESTPELAGTLYVDGHVRLYHGKKTKLPRRYISRLRLCLRGTTDYWVNDALGGPFFSIERTIDHGLLEALENDIVPRLLKEVPGQPSQEELDADPYRSRFTIVFDREGYSPAFFREMWQKHRIACITYHKFPKEDWPEEWFTETVVTMPNGEQVTMKLAEMGSWIGDKKSGLWVLEVRKLSPSGHQTSLISTDFARLGRENAAGLFTRWSQENFFRYMMQEFAIDLLSEYATEEIPGTNRPVVNPAWRPLDRKRRSVKGKLTNRQARFAALTLQPETDSEKLADWEKRKAELVEEIQQYQHELDELDAKLKQTPKHVEWEALDESQKFERLAPSRKRLMDTIKLIAYRAETAMSSILRESLARTDDSRSLLRDLFKSDADLLPDPKAGVLRVHVHTMANPRSNRSIAQLLEHLNAAEFTYPGTNLKLVYSIAAQRQS
jgi:transposase